MNSRFICIAFALIFGVFSPTSAPAAELAGVKFAEKIEVKSQPLVLNGLGLRTATFLSIKVYVAALYLENKSSSAQDILTSKERKQVVLHFVRSVSASKLQTAWRDGFAANVPQAGKLAAQVEELCNAMADVEDGDVLTFDIGKDEVVVTRNKKLVGTISGAEFAQNLLAVWIGSSPPNEGLKNGLLGGK